MTRESSTDRMSLGERVYEDLRVAIVLGEIPQGRVFNEADLMARYKVSTSPLREALTRLRQDGLVKVIPRRGYSVTELTLRDFHELVQMRMIVEGAAAELAAPHIRDEHVLEMRRLSSATLVVGDKTSYRVFMQSNQSFHELIASASENGRIVKATKQTFDEIQRVLFTDLTEAEDGNLTHDHDEIIEALAKRDGAAARRAVIEHIKQSRDRVIRRMLRRDDVLERMSLFT
ncbi:GntR family transcriptional regulator [Pinisolibacter aquiterrae]|uniref:GntR family transcriptional regulator n=1 Tax=Pinisolibacter aquiterrae TaxID=2815579 RepID=UPI001C3DE724|nr:GntR family transcriptional regulator [Pinisolibacter aquiterrae]MBV5263871.1 GntR family transcriptional regulator [Pinisolibacter aquiterrae]MCC8235730.1 GntR family transcriptional regulator [Pinisolibacter aquiterrae]